MDEKGLAEQRNRGEGLEGGMVTERWEWSFKRKNMFRGSEVG